jgi:hypothetical protein
VAENNFNAVKGLALTKEGGGKRRGENGDAMTTAGPSHSCEKRALIWAERREKLIAVRIYFEVSVERGCTLYELNRVEEIG